MTLLHMCLGSTNSCFIQKLHHIYLAKYKIVNKGLLLLNILEKFILPANDYISADGCSHFAF